MAIQSLSATQHVALNTLHDEFGRKALFTGCSTAAASFLLIGALIIITCGCLCLMLPGINVVNHVILPAVIPGICAIVLSIPFILMSIRFSTDKNTLREQTIEKMITLLDDYEIPEMSEKNRVRFIIHNLLDWPSDLDKPGKVQKNTDWSLDYQKKILGDIKEKMGTEKSERNPRQEKIIEALDSALIKIQKKRKNSK